MAGEQEKHQPYRADCQVLDERGDVSTHGVRPVGVSSVDEGDDLVPGADQSV